MLVNLSVLSHIHALVVRETATAYHANKAHTSRTTEAKAYFFTVSVLSS